MTHHDYGDMPLSQARTLRGRIPAAVLRELIHRPDPYFAASGVRPVRVL